MNPVDDKAEFRTRGAEASDSASKSVGSSPVGYSEFTPAQGTTPNDRADGETGQHIPASGTLLNDPAEHPTEIQTPESFGRYRLRRLLGKGGMGRVYLAYDTQLNRLVALKIPKPRNENNSDLQQRFMREAKVAAGLSHPNLCSIYDVGIEAETLYLTMEYIEGESLAHVLGKRRTYPPKEAAALVAKVARAMQVVHRKDVVHRDLKPANIIVRPDGEPVVTDFGLARIQVGEDMTKLTDTGALLGTPSYMAPEQINPELGEMGPSVDIYSLGVVLYELLAGRPPFQGPPGAVIGKILTEPPKRIGEYAPGTPIGLERICSRAMSKTPHDRISTMNDLAQRLEAWLANPTEFDVALFGSVDSKHAPNSPDELANLLVGNGIVTEVDWHIAVGTVGHADDMPNAILEKLSKQKASWTDSFPEHITALTAYQVSEIRAGRGLGLRAFRDFLILDAADAGGWSKVYKARGLGPYNQPRFYAINALEIKIGVTAEFNRQFVEFHCDSTVGNFQEGAQLLARLRHPNLPVVYASDKAESGAHYVITDFLNGPTLAEMIHAATSRGELLDWKWATQTILTIAEVLQHCHTYTEANGDRRPVIHRNIKPSNIVVKDERTPMLVGLGIAKLTTTNRQMTDRSTSDIGPLGTPAFMPLEQWVEPENVSPASDICSLAGTYYNLLTGELPFPAEDANTLFQKIQTAERPKISAKRKDVPKALDRIIVKAMAIKPEARYQSAQQFIDALKPYAVLRPELTTVQKSALGFFGGALSVAFIFFFAVYERQSNRGPDPELVEVQQRAPELYAKARQSGSLSDWKDARQIYSKLAGFGAEAGNIGFANICQATAYLPPENYALAAKFVKVAAEMSVTPEEVQQAGYFEVLFERIPEAPSLSTASASMQRLLAESEKFAFGDANRLGHIRLREGNLFAISGNSEEALKLFRERMKQGGSLADKAKRAAAPIYADLLSGQRGNLTGSALIRIYEEVLTLGMLDSNKKLPRVASAYAERWGIDTLLNSPESSLRQADEDLKMCLRLDPDNQDSLLRAGVASFLLKQDIRASAFFARVKNRSAVMNARLALAQSNRLPQEFLDAMKVRNSDERELQLKSWATKSLAAGRFAEVIAGSESATLSLADRVTLGPLKAQAYLKRGEQFLNDDPQFALGNFLMAKSLMPSQSNVELARLTQSAVQNLMVKPKKLETDAYGIADRDPERALKMATESIQFLEQLPNSDEQFRKARSEAIANNHLNIAEIFSRRNDLQNSLAHCREAIRVAPNYYFSQIYLATVEWSSVRSEISKLEPGKTLADVGELTVAVEAVCSAIVLDPVKPTPPKLLVSYLTEVSVGDQQKPRFIWQCFGANAQESFCKKSLATCKSTLEALSKNSSTATVGSRSALATAIAFLHLYAQPVGDLQDGFKAAQYAVELTKKSKFLPLYLLARFQQIKGDHLAAEQSCNDAERALDINAANRLDIQSMRKEIHQKKK